MEQPPPESPPAEIAPPPLPPSYETATTTTTTTVVVTGSNADANADGGTAPVGQFPPSPDFHVMTKTDDLQPIDSNNATTPPGDKAVGQQQSQPAEKLTPHPQQLYCPTCNQSMVSQVKYVPGIFTWILAIVFIIFGLFCGCCLIPFLLRQCKDCEHWCPECRTYLGTYQRLFGTRRRRKRVPGERK